MKNTCIEDFLNSERFQFDKDVDLKTKTWIKRGGIATFWVQPLQMFDFEKLIIWCQRYKVQFEVIGNTSNCYFLNSYNPCLVISTLKLNSIKIEESTLTCECGYNMMKLSNYCISQGIAKFEGFIGLPGTVGGAAVNNSGCYLSLISNVVSSVNMIVNGEKVSFSNEQMKYSHRNSVLKSNEIKGVITSVVFNIEKKEDNAILYKRAKKFNEHRKKFQEHVNPNLGSTFSSLEFKRLSCFLGFVSTFLRRIIILVTAKDSNKQQKLKTKLFLILRGGGNFKKYVSDCGIRCFTWSDNEADNAFVEYLKFIKKNTTKAVIEIDIKGE
jgi:UDP-N-acetylmuramate dehydrogenase